MENKEQPKVVIYSTPTCPYCYMAKDYFKKHEIKFEEYNVQVDLARRQEMLEKTDGGLAVPVITIGDEVIIGFDRVKIDSLLGITSHH